VCTVLRPVTSGVLNRDVAGSDLHQDQFQFGALDPSVMVS